jgi:hypothetical protein
VEVKPGETVNIELKLDRNVDLTSKGWFNGSTHVHMNYGGHLRNTPAALLAMARAQGVHIVSGLVANKDNRILDWQYFRPGNPPDPASDIAARSLLLFGEENRPPFWGHTFYIGLRENLISPFLTGYEGTALNSLWPSNSELFRKARAQGAATGYVHAFGGESDPLAGSGVGGAKGYAVDVALGLIDCLEWSAASRGSLIPLFHAWNNDFHIAPVGGEDALANMQDHRPVGIIRTFAYLGRDFSVDGWINALKQGRTIVSSGPVIQFSVNGEQPGGSVKLPAPGSVKLAGQVWSNTPIRLVRVYRNGEPWKSFPLSGEPTQFSFEEQAMVETSSWFSLVVEADEQSPAPQGAYAQAISNSVRVYTGDDKIRSKASAEYFLRWIDRLRGEIADPKLWRTDREKERAMADLDAAAAVYRSRAAE